MPWYYNYLQIYGNEADILKIYESNMDFQKLDPCNLKDENERLMWCDKYWNSWSNRKEFYITQHYLNTIEGSFRTPSVPHALLTYLTILFPSVHITCMFEEEEYDIVGMSTYSSGHASVKYIRPSYTRLDVLKVFSEKNRWFDYSVYMEKCPITGIKTSETLNVFEWSHSYRSLVSII